MSRDANVVQFYGTALPPSGGSVLLVMEFMPVRLAGFSVSLATAMRRAAQ